MQGILHREISFGKTDINMIETQPLTGVKQSVRPADYVEQSLMATEQNELLEANRGNHFEGSELTEGIYL